MTRIIVKINKCLKESFVVIGKEGSTSDGENFNKGLYLAGVECIDDIMEHTMSRFSEKGYLVKENAPIYLTSDMDRTAYQKVGIKSRK